MYTLLCTCSSTTFQLIKIDFDIGLLDITGRHISTNVARRCEHPISRLRCPGSLLIEQKNLFIQNVNKHMYSLEKLSPATKWHIFSQKFLVNPDWKYYQNITWKKLTLIITLLRPKHWVKPKRLLSWRLSSSW